MNRHYSAESYLEKLDILRKHFDDPALTTDVIVGFPGETEAEFQETVRFLEMAELFETHIFRYSRRAGTKADRMEGQLTEQVKAERAEVLEEMSRSFRERYIERHIGKPAEVLFEEPEGAHTPNAWKTSRDPVLEPSQPDQETEKVFGGSENTPESGGKSYAMPPEGAKTYAGYSREYIRVSMSSSEDLRGSIRSGVLRRPR
jgi:tRNA A37 methylthiotransferase MiaB